MNRVRGESVAPGMAVGPVFLALALWLFGAVGLRRYTSTGS